MNESPYKVLVSNSGCAACKMGKRWTVQDPDGACGGTEYAKLEDARHEAAILNDAYEKGRASLLRFLSPHVHVAGEQCIICGKIGRLAE